MLLGSLLVAHISLHGLARAELPEERRRDFFLYLDEFQTFATKNLTAMLSELRKYRVSLILANQYLDQLDPEIRHAIVGNVGTLITFPGGTDRCPDLGPGVRPGVRGFRPHQSPEP